MTDMLLPRLDTILPMPASDIEQELDYGRRKLGEHRAEMANAVGQIITVTAEQLAPAQAKLNTTAQTLDIVAPDGDHPQGLSPLAVMMGGNREEYTDLVPVEHRDRIVNVLEPVLIDTLFGVSRAIIQGEGLSDTPFSPREYKTKAEAQDGIDLGLAVIEQQGIAFLDAFVRANIVARDRIGPMKWLRNASITNREVEAAAKASFVEDTMSRLGKKIPEKILREMIATSIASTKHVQRIVYAHLDAEKKKTN